MLSAFVIFLVLFNSYLPSSGSAFLNEGELPSHIVAPLKKLENLKHVRLNFNNEDPPPEEADEICELCNTALFVMKNAIDAGASRDIILNLAVGVCTFIEPEYVCRGLGELNIDALLYIVESRPLLTPSLACNLVFQSANCGGEVFPDWSITIDNSNSTHLKEAFLRKRSEMRLSRRDNLRFLHVTDTHYDPNYLVGGNAECGTATCCRNDQELPELEEHKAGRWGDYRSCDSPWEPIQDMLLHIKETHKDIDYIYYTGDAVDHGVWATSFEQNVESLRNNTVAIRQIFPNVPLYPIIGNHEPNPLNQISPTYDIGTSLGTHALYREMGNMWNWLPFPVRSTIDAGGYYTVLLEPGLRLIALNNNDCNTMNFWLLYDHEFPKAQLVWLYNTLLRAEANGEVVHILSHIPSGDSGYWNVCSREYRRIIERFSHVISAQFNGHSHRDQFQIYYSLENPTTPINIAWNGGSATPYSFVNYNYRLYDVERRFYQVVDHETWIFNLTEANLPENSANSPIWFKEYSFKEAYGLTDNLSPAQLDSFLTKLATRPDLLRQYFEFYIKQSDPRLDWGCDNNCLIDLLCQISITSFRADRTRCNELAAVFWEGLKRN